MFAVAIYMYMKDISKVGSIFVSSCRQFTEDWKDLATIKKDDMLCLTWSGKG